MLDKIGAFVVRSISRSSGVVGFGELVVLRLIAKLVASVGGGAPVMNHGNIKPYYDQVAKTSQVNKDDCFMLE